MKSLCFSLLVICLVQTLPLEAQNIPRAVRVGITYPSVAAFVMGTGEQLSGQQFQTDGILTHKGYQYTVYYNANRNVCIARRKLPQGAWEELVLPYRNTINDAHNTISIGISHGDGRIHLAYDHHNDPLRYSYSIVGSANDPENMPWVASSFSPTTQIMDKAVPNVTYPRFISMPNGNLLFECRFRWSGFGDSYLREYNAVTQTWSMVGRYIQGEDFTPDACAYINGMSYDHRGRLHITWCWRDDFGGGSNHGFLYAFSDDHGRSWKDNTGVVRATADVMDPVFDNVTRGAIGQRKPGFLIEAIPHNRGYINQETQDVDSKGRIHAVTSHIPDGQASDANWNSARSKSRLHHRFRREDGSWVRRLITVNGQSVHSIRRVHLAIDSFDNAYIVANGFGVIMASPHDEYATWTLLSEDARTGFLSEPLVDKPLLREQGVLSFVYLSSDQKIAVFDYLTRNPNTPNGTGLTAEYFSNANFTGLISQQLVASPEQSIVPAGTKSIRFSGTFETLLGEAYTLQLQTAYKTHVYVNDRLQQILTASQGVQTHSIQYPLIASHKNNIVIEMVGSTSPVLTWSSAGTPMQSIPTTSLYPAKLNAAPPAPIPPVLPQRVTLEQVLMETKRTIQTSERDVMSVVPFNPLGDYTLEVKAKINHAEGRGLDVEARTRSGKGFRVSLDRTNLRWTSPLTEATVITPVDHSVIQTYRFAVQNDKVHIFRDQEFIATRDATFIHDILDNDQESLSAGTFGPNVIGNWAGPSGLGTAMPTAYGWTSTGATVPWNSANGTSGVRYLDITSATVPVHWLNSTAYTGRLLTLRWDGALGSNVYYYPVNLEANTTYEFSMVYEHWNNGPIGAPITVGISKTATASGIYDSSTFPTVERNRLQHAHFRFTTQEAGQYFITFVGTAGTMYGVGELTLRSIAFENRLLVGKNYRGGNASIDVYSITFQEGAFAPGYHVVEPPVLPEKAILPLVKQEAINLLAPHGTKTIQLLDFDPPGDYTLEITANVIHSQGRGLDFEARDGMGIGFRTSLAEESLRWAAPFTGLRQIHRSDNSTQTIRYAVSGQNVHVFKNGKFIETFNLTSIGNMNDAGTAEVALTTPKPTNLYDGVNLFPNPDFQSDAHNAAPAGWTSDRPMGGAPNSRVQEKGFTTELSAYPDGQKAFMFRFDGSGGSFYAYRMRLATNQWFELSFDLITWGENQNAEFDVVVAENAEATAGIIQTQRVRTPAVRATANRQVIRFRTSTATTATHMDYFIVFRRAGAVGTIAVTDMYLAQRGVNQLLFGKNYTEGAASFQIHSIRADYSGAFAPSTLTSEEQNSTIHHTLIFGGERYIQIQHLHQSSHINVYDLTGRRVYAANAISDSHYIAMSPGVYIVRINQQSQKVMVR